MWNIGNLQKPRWQILSSSGSCKGHSRIVFSLSAGSEHCATLVSVSMDRQVSFCLCAVSPSFITLNFQQKVTHIHILSLYSLLLFCV